MTSFHDWFNQYPKKVGFKQSRKVWDTLTTEQQKKALDAIPNHVKLWKAENTLSTYIPFPHNWLANERWTDEILLPDHSIPWWTSTEATMQFGRDRGIQARPGEDLAQYRARLRAA